VDPLQHHHSSPMEGKIHRHQFMFRWGAFQFHTVTTTMSKQLSYLTLDIGVQW
jgi:hypothetical protein